VRGVINFLPAKVPDVDLEGASIFQGKLPADDINAACGGFVVKPVLRVLDFLSQGSLACAPFSHEE